MHPVKWTGFIHSFVYESMLPCSLLLALSLAWLQRCEYMKLVYSSSASAHGPVMWVLLETSWPYSQFDLLTMTPLVFASMYVCNPEQIPHIIIGQLVVRPPLHTLNRRMCRQQGRGNLSSGAGQCDACAVPGPSCHSELWGAAVITRRARRHQWPGPADHHQ